MSDFTRIVEALQHDDASIRLQAALAAGTEPADALLPTLVARSGVEPDFYVRDMLTWAITRFPSSRSLPLLIAELNSPAPAARSQALHSLSKIGDGDAWLHLTADLLTDPDDEVARSAWRAAAVLVPDDERAALAATLATQFGRGDRELHRSLSRAFVELGNAATEVVATARRSVDPVVAGHATATEQLMRDPESAFTFDLDTARRVVALGEHADQT